MKIGIVTPAFHPYPGGVTEHVHHAYVELRKLGHDVRILTTRFGRGGSPMEDDVIRLGHAVYVPANGSVCPVPVGWHLTERAREVLDREGFDVLHVHEPLMPMLCLSVLRAARVPVVGTFHASNERGAGYRLFRPVLAPYFSKLSRCICVSEAARESIRPHFGGTYDLIPNGVDVARFAEAPRTPELRDGAFNMLFVGRMEPRKGAKYLFRAMPAVLRKVPEARLTVVGAGPLRPYYRAFVPPSCRKRVVFRGRVDGGTLAALYRTADVYCSPATGGESFGIVLLEAMAAGTAIVASRIPGYASVVRDGETALLVRPRSPGELAEAIIRLRQEPETRERLVAAGRRAVQRYSWERIGREIAGVLEEAAGAGAVGNGKRRTASADRLREESGCLV
jgi:phosphatidylinositol alpha-mannosyltransferase